MSVTKIENDLIGKRIEKIRKKNNKKQREIAEYLGMKRENYTMTEIRENSRYFKDYQILDLSKYFKVSSDYLLGLTEEPSPDVTVKAINRKYGLSEKALNNLEKMQEHKKNGDTIIDTTNKLLEQSFYENNDGSSIISLIDSYLEENGNGISLTMKRKNGVTTTISGKDVINSFLVILARELSNMKEGEK